MNTKVRTIVALLALTLVIGLASLAGCGGPGPTPNESPVQTPTTGTSTPPPSPTPMPSPTESPIPPTATPRTFSIPEGPPYEGEPFAIVFQRDGELWMSEVGGRGEWQLTHEGPAWAPWTFAISPDGQYIAFITWDQTASRPWCQNQYIELVRVRDGSTQALTSPDDPYDEFNLAWWDTRRVTFQVRPREGFPDTELQPYTIVVADVETGERTFEPASASQSRSPDGRYVLVGDLMTVRPTAEPYWLYDRETGEQWMVAGENEETKFLGWSPDGRWMLFGLSEGEGVGALFVVGTETRARLTITPPDKIAPLGTAWSPDSQTIAYIQCDPPASGCQHRELWLTSPDGSNRRQIPVGIPDFFTERIFWTPDGSQLVFAERLHNPLPETNYYYIWSMRVDGTDLRPIAIGHQNEFQVSPLP